MLHIGVCCAVMSVPCRLVVTCWERADLLAVVCIVFCHFPKCVLVQIGIKGRGWRRKTGLSYSVIYFDCPFQGGTPFLDHVCYLCLVFLMLSRLFIAALWSPRKGLTSWLLFAMSVVILFLSHLVSWVWCGTLYRYLILAVFPTFIQMVI